MAEQFENMGGVSNSEPNWLIRFISSRVLQRLADPDRRQQNRDKLEQQRQRRGAAHVVEYFHQVEDPYSYLAAQILQPLLNTYDIELVMHLVHGPVGHSNPEPELLLPYAQADCEVVAPHYGLEFPVGARAPGEKQIALANRMLAAAPQGDLPQLAVTVGQALWSGDIGELKSLAARLGEGSQEETEQRLADGSAHREKLGHYSGAMFNYAGEWYWGVDRLYHLENRLLELGVRRDSGRQLLVPRPGIEMGTLRDNGSMTLEIYPSLRSPYTSIIFDKAVSLARHTRINLIVRPVLPMVMRGVPISRLKAPYIGFDTAREAETLGLQWGKAWDPIGNPVRKALSLYLWAEGQGKGIALLSAFMKLAWTQRVNTNSNSGLRKVVEVAGLDWKEARSQMDIEDEGWQQLVEGNRQAMYAHGIWGVPAFRLLDREGNTILATWGQDRLWLVARLIQERLREAKAAS